MSDINLTATGSSSHGGVCFAKVLTRAADEAGCCEWAGCWEQLSGADAIAEELAVTRVDRVFGLPGGEMLLLMDALRRSGIEFVLCQHEGNAWIMRAMTCWWLTMLTGWTRR
jgi:thiamine pyrophosphate-dependent enzyme